MDILNSICNQWVEQYLELEKLKQELEANMNALKSLIERNGGALPSINPSKTPLKEAIVSENVIQAHQEAETNYNSKGTWADKIILILSRCSDYLDVYGIANKIKEEEPDKEINSIIKAVTMASSKMGIEKKIEVKKIGNKNFYKNLSTSIVAIKDVDASLLENKSTSLF